MAKRKTEKKLTEEENRIVLIDNLIMRANEMQGMIGKEIVKINQCIDRIITAHEKCKSLKGI